MHVGRCDASEDVSEQFASAAREVPRSSVCPTSGSSGVNESQSADMELASVDEVPRVLDFKQLERLRNVIETPVPITGRHCDQVPTLRVRPLDLVRAVRDRLRRDGICLRDIRLNGGAASYVLGGGSGSDDPTTADFGCAEVDGPERFGRNFRRYDGSRQDYNDLDLIFRIHLSGPDDQERVRDAVLAVLPEFIPSSIDDGWFQNASSCASSSSTSSSSPSTPSTRSSTPTFGPLGPSSSSLIGHSYVHKMFRIFAERGDRWSLISLSNVRGRSVELKFADVMRRQFQFSVDSFQIVLDGLLAFYDAIDAVVSSPAVGTTIEGETVDSAATPSAALSTTPNFYPTVYAVSAYGRIAVALDHLRRKLIVTRHPEEIRGGGLLKYCSLLVRGYRTLPGADVSRLERYMCSRFFIDFPRLDDQRSTLENYMAEHFVNPDDRRLRLAYLSTLGRVIDSSSSWGHMAMGFSSERVATLHVVRQMALDVLAEERMILQQHHFRRHTMMMMTMTSPGSVAAEAPPSPPGSPNRRYVDSRSPVTVDEQSLTNRYLRFSAEPNDGSPPTSARLMPRPIWIGVSPSTDVTSLALMDINGNQLEVERIDYGPHPMPRQRCSSSRQPNSNSSNTTESELGDDRSRQIDQLPMERQCCSLSVDDSCGSSETVPDQFYVVYTYTTTTAVAPGDDPETATFSGATHVVRSCTPYYVVGSPRRCCTQCCYRSHGNVADPRTGCQTG